MPNYIETMKITLFMAMSLDWYIADRKWGVPWSDEDWENYKTMLWQADALVIWSTTYKEMQKDWDLDEFSTLPIFIFSTKNRDDNWNHIFIDSYTQFSNICLKKGLENICIGWWTKLNSFFLREGNIDEIKIDIEPFIFGDWTKLFESIPKNYNLKLEWSKKYWTNWLQLHYKVKS